MSAGLRRGDQQITAVLHHQRYHIEVRAVKLGEALVGGNLSTLITLSILITQNQRHPVILLLVFLQMGLQQLLVSLPVQRGQCLLVLFLSVATDVLIVHEVRGCGDIECRCGGTVHVE